MLFLFSQKKILQLSQQFATLYVKQSSEKDQLVTGAN